jgi:hypothetical protein
MQKIKPPKNAQIKELTLTVDLSTPWKDAVQKAGKDTGANFDVWKVGDLYPAAAQTIETELVLLNYPDDGSFDKALTWAKENGLELTTPREVFALSEQNDLASLLGASYGWVVSTTACTFGGERQAPYVWWNDSKRGADLSWVSDFGHRLGWFAFRKSSTLKSSELFDPLNLDLASAIKIVKENGYRVMKEM